jgi:RecA/RadA recombinase
VATQTGIFSFDLSSGGGLPPGLIEIYGPKSVGKTALLGQILSFAQRTGMSTALVAAEYFDEPYFRGLGVDTTALPLIRSGSEDVEDLMLDFVRTQRRGILAIDSVTAVRLEDEQPGEWNEFMLSLLSRMRSLLSVESCVVMTSQIRVKRSADPRRYFGGVVDSASRRLADLFSMRLELSRSEVTDKTYRLAINIVSNTLGPPATIVEVPAKKGSGVDLTLDLVRVAQKTQVIERRGPKYYFGSFYLGIGEQGAAVTLRYDSDLQLELIGQLLERCSG